MSIRQGLWQRICGACLAVIIVLALEATIPSGFAQASNPSQIKKSTANSKLLKPSSARVAVRYTTTRTCRNSDGVRLCRTRVKPVLVPVTIPSSTTTTTTLPSVGLPNFMPNEILAPTPNSIVVDEVEDLPGVIFVPVTTTTTTTTTTTRPTTTTTTTTTTTSTTTTTTRPTTTTPPSTPTTPGPFNRNILTTSGPITITQDGAVIQNVNVQGQITVAANNVTIRNFRANNIYKNPGKVGLVMEYGDLHGEQNSGADGVVWSGYTARYLNVYNLFDAFKAHGDVLIENCWVHDLNFRTGPSAGAGGYTHNDGVQVSSGSNVTIRNSIFERNLGNAAIFIDADQGPINNVVVEGNRLGGGGFTLYSIQSRSAPQFGRPTNVTIRNNVFTEEHHFDYATIAPTGTTWTNNKNLSGALINPRIDNF